MFSEYVLAGSSVVSLDFLPPALCTTENSTEPPSKTLNENLRTDGALMSIGTSKSSPGARLCTRESIVPPGHRGRGTALRRGGRAVRTSCIRSSPHREPVELPKKMNVQTSAHPVSCLF